MKKTLTLLAAVVLITLTAVPVEAGILGRIFRRGRCNGGRCAASAPAGSCGAGACAGGSCRPR